MIPPFLTHSACRCSEYAKAVNSEFIAQGDCLGLPGTPFKKYDTLEVDADEQARFDAAGLMIEDVAPMPHDDFAKIALPVQHIDFLSSGPDAVALI